MVILAIPEAGQGQQNPNTHQNDVTERTHDCSSPLQMQGTPALDKICSANRAEAGHTHPSYPFRSRELERIAQA
jgi:hypothetical protein